MRILLLNPPHVAIGSRMPREHLPPLGLLAVGGALIDAGHDVSLLDAEFGPMSEDEIVWRVAAGRPEAVLLGHSGSTSAHPIIAALTRRIRAELPSTAIVYGGVYPSYHYRDILADEPQIDVIVRGEGEAVAPALLAALEKGSDLAAVRGIAFRRDGRIVETPPAPIIDDLDACRVGWELVDLTRYGYYGKRGVVVQFSRGCPHACTYCGQRGFWRRWRHRSPAKFASEVAWLHRTHGVQVFDLADENPTSDRAVWREVCEAIIAENIPVTFITTMRADDIVRDADILHLYRKAGVERILLGIENTDEATLRAVRKGGATATDREAIRLLRRHGIISLTSWVVDFNEVSDRDLFRSLRQLISYDPDQITALYATPYRWTPYGRQVSDRRVVQFDRRLWDYKHQVLESRAMPPWRLMLWVKGIEVAVQARPKALWRTFLHPDPAVRYGMKWYTRIGRRVWFHEVFNFLFRDRRARNGPALSEFWSGHPIECPDRNPNGDPVPARSVEAPRPA